MNPKPNISLVNALIRITVGLTVLAWSTAKLSKKPWRESYLMMAMLGAMKVAEGVVRFCPLVALFETSQEKLHDRHNRDPKEEEQLIPYNPS